MARDKLLSGWSPNSVSQFLAETAAGRGSRDDTSVILSVIGGAFVAAAEAAAATSRLVTVLPNDAVLHQVVDEVSPHHMQFY